MEYNNIELILFKFNKELGQSVYNLRKKHLNDNFFNNLFINITLPLSILIILYINTFTKNNNIDHIIFLSRDSYWFKHIYDIIFNTTSYYMYFSRLLVSNNKKRVIDEINNISGSKILIDLYGSGNTFNIIKDELNDCDYLVCFNWSDSSYGITNIINNNFIGELLEDVFSAPHPSLLDFTYNNYVLKKMEYDIKLLKEYMKLLELWKNEINKINKLEVNLCNLNDLSKYIKLFAIDKTLYEKYYKNLKEYINHLFIHTNEDYQEYPLIYDEKLKDFIINEIKFSCNGKMTLYNSNIDTTFLKESLNWTIIYDENNNEKKDFNYII